MKNLVILFTCCCLANSAQNRWDLQGCINYAISHNISLKQSALNNEINSNNAEQAKAGSLPSLNAGASHVYNIGKTIDRFTNTFANQQVLSQNFYIASSVVLWSGFSQYNNIKATEYKYLSGVENLKQQQNDLSLNVANAYIGVIFSEEILKISQNQFNITSEQLERTMKLVNAGAAARSVEYDIKAQLANEEVNVTTAENNYQIALLTLRQLMNLDSVPGFEVVRPVIDMPESPQLIENDVQYIYELSLKNQPGIKSSEYSILSAEKYLASARGRRSPTLTFNASLGTGTSGLARKQLGTSIQTYTVGDIPNVGPITTKREVPVYSTGPTPFSEQFSENVNKSFGVTLNIPLFNGLQTHTSVKNAKISAFNAKLSQDLTKQNLYKNIAQAYANAKAALNKYNASKSSVEAANESFKYAQQKFNSGVISSFDFNSAKNRLYSAESNMLQAKYDYVFKLKVLDYYQGKPLGF
jgi:outer membrane protein